MESSTDRRSGRARKPVTYPGDLSDDDFADTTPPPPKKTKVSSKPTKAKASSLSIEPILDLNNSSLRSKKSRKPPAEKAFDRELQQALQISLLETTGSQEEIGTSATDSTPPPLQPLSPIPQHKNCVDDPTPPALTSSVPSVCSTPKDTIVRKPDKTITSEKALDSHRSDLLWSYQSALPHTAVMDESIEVLSENVDPDNSLGKTRRRNCRKLVIESDEDNEETSDFAPEQADNDNSDESESEEEEEDESEESEAESDDSDFAPKSKAKKNKDKKKATDLPTKSNAKINKLTSRKQAQASNKSDKNPSKNSSETKPSSPVIPEKPATAQPPSLRTPSAPKPTFTAPKISPSTPKISPSTPKISPSTPNMPPSASKTPSSTSTKTSVRAKSRATSSTSTTSSPSTSSSTSSSSSSSHKALCSPSTLTAQWKPPARATDKTSSPNASSVKSPSSGLRLGLSRNMKVKPLHSSVKVT